MQLRRNEIMTGLLVVGTVAVIVGVLILLGAPGLFRPLVTYKIYFDNAAGIKLGAPVLLAGRKIGQVQKLYSPVSQEEDQRAQEAAAQIRPPDANASASPSNGKPKFEVRIDVQVDKTALVYRDAHARMISLGLLGEMAIDITQGTEASGRAHDGEMYAGERTPDFSEAAAKLLEVVEPVAQEATKTMKELEATAQNLSHITDENSELNQALTQFKTFGEHLVDLTAPEGPLSLRWPMFRKSRMTWPRTITSTSLCRTFAVLRAAEIIMRRSGAAIEGKRKEPQRIYRHREKAAVAAGLSDNEKISG